MARVLSNDWLRIVLADKEMTLAAITAKAKRSPRNARWHMERALKEGVVRKRMSADVGHPNLWSLTGER